MGDKAMLGQSPFGIQQGFERSRERNSFLGCAARSDSLNITRGSANLRRPTFFNNHRAGSAHAGNANGTSKESQIRGAHWA